AVRIALEALDTQGRLAIAMDRLEAYKAKISIEHAIPFITALCDIGERLPTDDSGLSMISTKMHATRIVYWYLRQEKDPDRRLAALRAAITETVGVTLPVMVVALEDPERNDRQPRDPEEQLVSDAGLKDLKVLCVDKIRTAMQRGGLIPENDLAMVLYRWRDWAPDEATAFCREAAKSPEGALSLLRAFTSISMSSGMGDFVSRRHWTIRLDEVEKFFPWEELDGALTKVDRSQL